MQHGGDRHAVLGAQCAQKFFVCGVHGVLHVAVLSLREGVQLQQLLRKAWRRPRDVARAQQHLFSQTPDGGRCPLAVRSSEPRELGEYRAAALHRDRRAHTPPAITRAKHLDTRHGAGK